MSVSQASCVLCSPFRHSFRNFLLWSSRIMYKRAFKNKIGSIPLPELQWRQQECWPCPGHGRGRKGGLSPGRHGLWHRSLSPLGHVIGLKHASESTRICQWFPLFWGESMVAPRQPSGRLGADILSPQCLIDELRCWLPFRISGSSMSVGRSCIGYFVGE